MLDANDQIRSTKEYEELIVAWRAGAPIRLKDVAAVEQGAEDRFLAAWANQQAAVLVNIQRQPGANVIEVADRVQQLLPQLDRHYAGGSEGGSIDRSDPKYPRFGA